MKQPPYTVEPLVGGGEKLSLKQLLIGHGAGEACYEAHRDDNGVYLLWMEFSRFGTLRAYPCVVEERDGPALVFSSLPGEAAAEENDALLRRWQELVRPEAFHSQYRWNKLDKAAFQKIFRAYRERKKEV